MTEFILTKFETLFKFKLRITLSDSFLSGGTSGIKKGKK